MCYARQQTINQHLYAACYYGYHNLASTILISARLSQHSSQHLRLNGRATSFPSCTNVCAQDYMLLCELCQLCRAILRDASQRLPDGRQLRNAINQGAEDGSLGMAFVSCSIFAVFFCIFGILDIP